MQAEDTVPLMEPSVEQSPPDVVTHQPQPTTGISTISVIVKALLGETESHGCYCLSCPNEESQQSASALLIGTAKRQGQSADSQSSRSNPTYISRFKQHLTQQNIEIYRCNPNYHGSQDGLHQLISNFFSKSKPSLFILYYSGPTNERGDWSISTTDAYKEEYEYFIRLDTIANKWKAVKLASNCLLLIILDAPNSEKWVEKVKNRESEANIIIMGSSGSDNSDPSSLGQYTQSLMGSQGHGFFPDKAQEMIRKYLVNDPSSTNGLLFYVYNCFAYYKRL